MSAKLIRTRRRQLLEDVMDAYLEWREKCASVTYAYGRWADASRPDAAAMWRAYEDALDREEQASAVYDGLIRRVGARGGSQPEQGRQLAPTEAVR
jgi:hypothetical protein